MDVVRPPTERSAVSGAPRDQVDPSPTVSSRVPPVTPTRGTPPDARRRAIDAPPRVVSSGRTTALTGGASSTTPPLTGGGISALVSAPRPPLRIEPAREPRGFDFLVVGAGFAGAVMA